MERQRQSIGLLDDRDELAILQLCSTRGLGPSRITGILSELSLLELPPASLLDLSPSELIDRFPVPLEAAEMFFADNSDACELFDRLKEADIQLLVRGYSEYPMLMVDTCGDRAPPILFAFGNTSLSQKPSVGFCGSRNSSELGLVIAAACAEELARKDINIVSGGARGVDLAAHRAALKAEGTTTVVLAEGIFKSRAASELSMFAAREKFLVISEFPPGLPWSGRNAMIRNQLICGLSRVIILVESGTTGGTFECGKAAGRLGLPLFALEYPEPPESALGNEYFLDRGASRLTIENQSVENLEDVVQEVRQVPTTPDLVLEQAGFAF